MADPKASSKSYPWEDMLRAFAPTSMTDSASRDDVLAEAWLGSLNVITDKATENAKRKTDGFDLKKNAGLDMWAEWTYPGTGYSTLIGSTYRWDLWDKEGSILSRFEWAGEKIFKPLAQEGGRSDTTDQATFGLVAQTIADIDTWCLSRIDEIAGWAKHVDGADSDFQGSAANRFREVLLGLRSEFDQLHRRLGGTGGSSAHGGKPGANVVADKLRKAGSDMHISHGHLYDSWKKWQAGSPPGDVNDPKKWMYKHDDWRLAWPHACLHLAFIWVTMTLTPTRSASGSVTWVDTSGGPTPESGLEHGFAQALEQAAKNWWHLYVVFMLDMPAIDVQGLVTTSFEAAAGELGAFDPPRMILPTDKPPTSPDTKGGPDSKGGPDLKDDPNKKDIGGGTPPPLTGNHSGIGGTGGTGKGGSGTGGGQAPLLDKNGKPLLDKDGNPLLVPPGTTVNSKGQLIGPDGKPLLGPDGKPRTVPPGTTVGKPDPTGAGSVFKVPAGSKVNEDGTVTGPDGKPVLDSNGNPVVLDKGSTVDKDGTVRDAGGRTVSPFSQLLSDQGHALGLRGGSGSTGGSGTGGLIVPPLSWSGSDGLGIGSTGSFGGLGGSGGKALGSLTAGPPTVGTGGRLAELNGGSATGALAQEEAAAQQAAEESQLLGRGISTTGGMGGPMMPPMGMGGLGGAGAGQTEKERQRTTWLTEDEEVWGTDSGAVTGVIGR